MSKQSINMARNTSCIDVCNKSTASKYYSCININNNNIIESNVFCSFL